MTNRNPEISLASRIITLLQERGSANAVEICEAFSWIERSTVSGRLTQLHHAGTLERTPIKSKSGRPSFSYRMGDDEIPVAQPLTTDQKVAHEKWVAAKRVRVGKPPHTMTADLTQHQLSNIVDSAPPATPEEVSDAIDMLKENTELLKKMTQEKEESIQEQHDSINRLAEAMREAVGILTEVIASEMIAQVSERVSAHVVGMATSVREEMSQTQHPSAQELVQRIAESVKPAEKSKLMKVTILGLRPQQAGQIVTEFGDCFDLSFWRDESFDKLSSLAKNSDHCIALMEACSHNAVDLLNKAGCAYERLKGGTTTLRARLTNLYVAPH